MAAFLVLKLFLKCQNKDIFSHLYDVKCIYMHSQEERLIYGH